MLAGRTLRDGWVVGGPPLCDEMRQVLQVLQIQHQAGVGFCVFVTIDRFVCPSR